MIRFNRVSKSYNGQQAVSRVTFDVKPGELFGLIGPDGAGKTTLFRMLATVLLPDQGTITLNTRNVAEEYNYIRKVVGYMPGKFSLYQDLSVQENLDFFATIFKTTVEENFDMIADIFKQLDPFRNRKAGALSGGMKQKLALSCALIHKPLVLILDEPTFGVDAVSRKEFWETLKSIQNKGITILVSTPYMDEASLCDRVALINQGEILSIDTPEGIIRQFDRRMYRIASEKAYAVLEALASYSISLQAYSFGQSVHIYHQEALDTDKLAQHLSDSKVDFSGISESRPGIEDCFMNLMTQTHYA